MNKNYEKPACEIIIFQEDSLFLHVSNEATVNNIPKKGWGDETDSSSFHW